MGSTRIADVERAYTLSQIRMCTWAIGSRINSTPKDSTSIALPKSIKASSSTAKNTEGESTITKVEPSTTGSGTKIEKMGSAFTHIPTAKNMKETG